MQHLKAFAGAPGPVSGIVATPGLDSATVQWTVPATTTEVTNYTIVATPTGGNAAPVTAVSPSPTSLIGPLSPNASWNFTVTPNSVNGSGPPATTSAPTTPLSSMSASVSGYTDYPLTSGGNLSYANIAHADLRGIGRQDLIVGGGAGVNVFLNNGDGTFAQDVVYDSSRAYYSVAVAEVNGDGIPDIIATNYPTSNTVTILPGNGDGTFGTPQVINMPVGNYAYSLAVGDLNLDGHMDFVVGTDTAVVPFLNNGSGSFTAGTPQQYMVGNNAVTVTGGTSLAIADINGDGTPDVIATGPNYGCGYFNPNCVGADIFTDTSSGTLNPASFLVLGNDPEGFTKIFLMDVNGDGSPDIVVKVDSPSCTGGGFRVFLNNGSGGFNRAGTFGPTCSNDIALADMNGDGALDVVTASSGCFNPCPYDDQLGRVELGWGDGNFALASAELPTFQFARVATADLNGDGLPDVAATNGGVLRIILNTNPNQWAPVGGWLNAYSSFGGGFFCPACALQRAEQNALGMRGDPIDTATGNFYETFGDFNIPGRGQPLSFTHTYNSQAGGVDGPLGYGFSFAYSDSLSFDPGGVVTYTAGTGAQATFTPVPGTNSYTTSPHTLATLARSGSNYVLTQYGQLTLTFDSSGQLIQETDRNGYTTTLSYTGSQLTKITDNAGRSLSIGWTGSHITTVTDNNVSPPRTVTFGYNDPYGDLTDVTDVNNGHTHFGYDTTRPWQHLITTVTDPRNNTTTIHYDALQRVDWQQDGRGFYTNFSYGFDPSGNATVLVTDPANNQQLETFQYGLLTSMVKGYGTAYAATWTTKYDPITLAPTSTTDPNGHTTSYVTDAAGDTVRTVDALGRVTTATYNSFHEPLTQTDGNKVTTTYTYDSRGNLTSVSRPLVGSLPQQYQKTTYIYGNPAFPGDVTQVIDPDGNSTYFHYDQYGYVDEVKDPLGHVSGTVHNADGWVTASFTAKAKCTWGSSPPAGCSAGHETQYAYNPFGEVTQTTDPLNHVTKTTYDPDGNMATFQDAKQSSHTCATTGSNRYCTAYTYNADNQLTVVTRADGTTLTTDYNPDGTVADQKDGKRTTIISYGYNPLDQVSSTTDARSHVTRYTYDGAGNLLTKLDPVAGATCTASTQVGCTTYTYDAASQLKTVSYSDTPAENVTDIGYDNDGQRVSVTYGTQTTATETASWTYDSLHRLTSYTTGPGATVTYGYTYGSPLTYDLKNQVRSIAYPNGVGTVTQQWDAAGRLASVTDWNNKTTVFGYDANNNQTSQTVPSATPVKDTFGFDAADRIGSVTVSNGTVLFSATYRRAPNNRLTHDSSQNSSQGYYKYTGLNQLCYAGSTLAATCSTPPSNSFPYAFDHAGNLINNDGVTQKFNNADELCWALNGTSTNNCSTLPANATKYGYDTKGNRTHALQSSTAAICYAYDQANRLTSITTGTGRTCATPATVGTYTYNGDGMRESKTVSSTTTQFTWDGFGRNLLQQSAGSAVTSFLYGPGGLPFEQVTGATVAYLHHDQLGSTRLITDAAGSSSTATTIAYGPYGNVVSSAGSLTTPLMFGGQYNDHESGLYYLRARYYDPTTAQFLTVDPAIDSTLSPFAYVAGNPLNAGDPTGMWGLPDLNPVDWGKAAVGAVGSGVHAVVSYACDNATNIGDCVSNNVNDFHRGNEYVHTQLPAVAGGFCGLPFTQLACLTSDAELAAHGEASWSTVLIDTGALLLPFGSRAVSCALAGWNTPWAVRFWNWSRWWAPGAAGAILKSIVRPLAHPVPAY